MKSFWEEEVHLDFGRIHDQNNAEFNLYVRCQELKYKRLAIHIVIEIRLDINEPKQNRLEWRFSSNQISDIEELIGNSS